MTAIIMQKRRDIVPLKGAAEIAAIGLEVPYYALLDAKHKREEDDPTDPLVIVLGDAVVQIGSIIELLKEAR